MEPLAESSDPATRAGVARVLREAATTRALPALLALSADVSAEVREDVVAGLAKVGAEGARARLLELYAADTDVDVRRVALEALVAMPGAASDTGLAEALAAAQDSGDDDARQDAHWGLAALAGAGDAPGSTQVARVVRRLLGTELAALEGDLSEDDFRALLGEEGGVQRVAARRLAEVAGGQGSYPAYGFGLVRLLAHVGGGAAWDGLEVAAAGTTALAAAARRTLDAWEDR